MIQIEARLSGNLLYTVNNDVLGAQMSLKHVAVARFSKNSQARLKLKCACEIKRFLIKQLGNRRDY